MFTCHDVQVEKNGDVFVVRLGKQPALDDLTADTIRDELLGVVERPDCNYLLLDFLGVELLASAMLAKLVGLRRKMESKGQRLRLCGIGSHLRSVFARTKLDRLFDITDTEADALKVVVPQSPPVAETAI